jgi:hypothetical protein
MENCYKESILDHEIRDISLLQKLTNALRPIEQSGHEDGPIAMKYRGSEYKKPHHHRPHVPLFSTQAQTDLIATQRVITAHMYSVYRDLRTYVSYIKHIYLVASKSPRNSLV